MLESLRRIALCLALAATLFLAPLSASADEYDSQRSGHPLRIAGYILHPIGVVLDTLVFRPVHWVGSHEPFRTLFGHDSED